jgi:hypothetical protein
MVQRGESGETGTTSSRGRLSPAAAMFVRFEGSVCFLPACGPTVRLFQTPRALHVTRGPNSNVLAGGSDVTRFRELLALKPSQKSGAMNSDHARDREGRVSCAVAFGRHIG